MKGKSKKLITKLQQLKDKLKEVQREINTVKGMAIKLDKDRLKIIDKIKTEEHMEAIYRISKKKASIGESFNDVMDEITGKK